MSDPTAAATPVFPGADTSPEHMDRLRARHYNATITRIRDQHHGLWVMHVEPDEPVSPYEPGQYATLALGYWEPRVDDASEDFVSDPSLFVKLARRSYSLSSSILGDDGELVPRHPDELEFYIVLVEPDGSRIPALTPRIFAKQVGDRIYLGRKLAGRYTLEGVQPTQHVVFLSTGTGEAPQNQMTAELLRQGHDGRILNVVCVRYRRDLAYLDRHELLEETYPNYRYVALTTREPGTGEAKVYIQDLLESGGVDRELGERMDPDTTHVFLCGNPQMIGLPRWDDDGTMHFPESRGACEVLHERGFTLDHRRQRGNVHYEEYW
ncbi:MAG TPA: ferredoxin--NADP reductase [Acidimicrobiia bacterium]|nr:ferredoxin--NADP reductase [Acidimicrobiia bacterium]